MTSLFILSLVLCVSLVSVLGIYMTSGAFKGLASTIGDRRMKLGAAAVAGVLITSAAGASWHFAAQSREKAAPAEAVTTPPPEPANARQAGDLNVLVARLEERLKREPGDAQGLALYARTLTELKRYDAASAAYANAVRVLPDDAALHLEMADAAYMAGGQKWTTTAIAALATGLKLAPEHPEALWLAGKERFENKDYATAVRHWESLARVASPESDYAKEMKTALVEARALRDGKDPAAELARAGMTAASLAITPANAAAGNPRDGLAAELQSTLAAMNSKTGSVPPNSVPGTIRGTISLDPAMRGRVAPEDILFVFARHADTVNGAMPLAMLRLRAADLPMRFELGDNNAMSPDHRLSSAQKVIVTARISKSGDAKPRPGDLEGASAVISPVADNLNITISTTR